MSLKTLAYALAIMAIEVAASLSQTVAAEPARPKPPIIIKKGTLGLDLCESTPFVFKAKVYRLEWFRNGSVLRIMDRDAGQEISRFGAKHRFPCAYAEGDTVYVAATKETQEWTGDTLTLFTSKDLTNWSERIIFKHPQGKPFCNTSLCKADDRFVMSYEQNENGFHAQFLESKDLLSWTMLPNEQRHNLGRYNAPHCLRWHQGWFYLFYLEAGKPRGYEQYITRSRDLIRWEPSPLNPVLAASPEDHLVLNQKLTEADRSKVAKAQDLNNSDIDFCEYQGRLIINYSWGNQQGVEFLAEAEFDGTPEQFLTGWFPEETSLSRYDGRFCTGAGEVDFLRLIDESFAFFHANPDVPNLTMLYKSDWDTFEEGAGWGAWWIQNGYGFSYASTPFLQEPWFSTLQRSWDLFWDNQGDGKRMGLWGGSATANALSGLVAPDGCLGDTAAPGCIIYKQGDGNVAMHDWFHEATAAGVVMQAEILLAGRDPTALAHYLPKMERACDSIEKTRDPRNNLFFVGPACNLLAPSYGGVRQPDGTFGKGYLAGLSINYLAALDRMMELYRLNGDQAKLAEYGRRQKLTRESLSQLLTPAGYFVKSVEPSGVKHGVLGQKQFGYLEGVANADAVALRVVDDQTAESIYKQIAAYPAIRPFDFLLVNAPGLDDTYWNWGKTEPMEGFQRFGDWVNGGAWGTVEGRAILGYYRVGATDDVRRSAERAMKWAKEFRMDEPWSQRGENTHNPWSDSGQFQVGGVAVMIDNFAIPAATIRGLFDYEYRFDRLILRPRLARTITEYVQKEPVRFGEKALYISCRNGGRKVKSILVNGQSWKVESADAVDLQYDALPKQAKVEIVTEGGWTDVKPSPSMAPPTPAAAKVAAAPKTELTEALRRPYATLKAMERLLASEPNVAESERSFVREAIQAIEAWRSRTAVQAQGFFRPMTTAKRDSIITFYERAALAMHKGFAKRMTGYAEKGDARQRRVAALFLEAQK